MISKQLSIVAFFEAYESHTDDPDQPYSTEHESMAGEMVNRLSHTHPLFRVDNATGYSQLVTATLGTQYSSTIAPFKQTRNGRGALRALKAQFAGPAHWDCEVRNMNDFLMNMKWTGTTSFSLHGFLAKHRASFNTLQRCAEHVRDELPNERTRVGYLIDNIDCSDKDVTMAISHIWLDDGVDATGLPTGTRNDFERAVAFLLPTDPVRKKKRGGKRHAAHISATDGVTADVDAAASEPSTSSKKSRKVNFKPTCGNTGVKFRYYKPAEFNNLIDEQKAELKEHRKTNGNYKGAWVGKPGPGRDTKPKKKGNVNKRMVAALIKEHEKKKQKEEEEMQSFRSAIVNELRGAIGAPSDTPTASTPPLKRILQRAGTKNAAEVASADIAVKSMGDPDADRQQVEAAERCANSLFEKFKSMGTKTKHKSG